MSSTDTLAPERYHRIKTRLAKELDLRLRYRPEGMARYTSDMTGALAQYEVDRYSGAAPDRGGLSEAGQVRHPVHQRRAAEKGGG